MTVKSIDRDANNQLIQLFGLAHRQHENYTTEAFAHVVRHLLGHEPAMAAEFLDWLTDTRIFSEAAAPLAALGVKTQWRTETRENGDPGGGYGNGREQVVCSIPDLRIHSETVEVVIEVKLDAGLQLEQLCAYAALLVRGGKQHRALVGLTSVPPQLEATAACQVDGQVVKPVLRTWVDVASELRRQTEAAGSPLTRHVVEQFVGFLNHLGLAPMRVASGLSREVEAHRV